MTFPRKRNIVFSIGHSNHPIDEFLGLLQRHGITAVADVRSQPYSRRNPQFNKERLTATLQQHGIEYVFVGRELGARSNDPAHYENGQVQYCRLAKTASFESGIARVLSGAETYRVALMCAEQEPLDCHRTLLVSRALVALGADVVHILRDGRIELHEQTLERLVRKMRLRKDDLFADPAALIEQACAAREAQIAYVIPDPSASRTP
jgi:uncharacterized protein (DUF488 family)